MLTVDLERARIGSGHRVLDLGCGQGRHAFACLRADAVAVAIHADYNEVESVAGMIRAMREAGEIDTVASAVTVGDALALPLADESFDRVIISEVLEHLVGDEIALAELVRVLRPGGLLALSVPRAWPERVNWRLSKEYHNVAGGHVRIYRRRDLIDKVERTGLRKVDGHHAHSLHSPYWWLRCAVGVNNETNRFVKLYHRFLVWDIMSRPTLTQVLDRLLNPIVGKSLVLYFEKPL